MLLAQAQEKEIDGVRYRVLPLPTRAAARVLARLAKMASPAFGDLAQLVAVSKGVNSALEALVSGLLADLDDEAIVFAMEQFARCTVYEIGGRVLPLISDKGDDLDEHFRGRTVQCLQWLAFAAGVSFPFAKAIAEPTAPAVPASTAQ